MNESIKSPEIELPTALAPQEDVNSYTYSFSPALTRQLVDPVEIQNIFNQLVRFGGGCQLSREIYKDEGGTNRERTSNEVTVKITKRTPRSLVEKVFAELNATKKLKISLGSESYKTE